MGGLNKTIHFDFLIKALNKKIRAECLIKENVPNAPKPALLNLPQTFLGSGYRCICWGMYPGVQ